MQKQKDFLLQDEGGSLYAGKHLIIDVSDARYLDDVERIENMLVKCAEAAGATVLHVHAHVFAPSGGVSGVAILAESHISIHSWPEISYAAMDVFMCGDTRPESAIEIIKATFVTEKVCYSCIQRGLGVIV